MTTTEWERWVKDQRYNQNRYWAFLARNSRVSADEWRERVETKGEVIFSAEEAVELGLVDQIVDKMPEAFQLSKQP